MYELGIAWRQLLHDYAVERNLRYEVMGDVIMFRFGGEAGGRSTVTTFVRDDPFLSIYMQDDRYVTGEQVPMALVATDRYNAEHKIPKAYVHEYEDGRYDIRGDWHLPLRLQVTGASFGELVDVAFATRSMLYEWLYENFGL